MIENDHVNFVPDMNVSRETKERITTYVDLLIKWNATINLVSKSSINQMWNRHILDSSQVFDYGHDALRWADFGSGGGLPGLMVAILALEKSPQMHVTLVESDQRKAAFLRHVGQKLGLNTQVITDRIESVPSLNANVVSARALAPLPLLCAFAHRHLAPGGFAIFHKGKSAQAEISEARRTWQFSLESHVSSTDSSSSILLLKGLARG